MLRVESDSVDAAGNHSNEHRYFSGSVGAPGREYTAGVEARLRNQATAGGRSDAPLQLGILVRSGAPTARLNDDKVLWVHSRLFHLATRVGRPMLVRTGAPWYLRAAQARLASGTRILGDGRPRDVPGRARVPSAHRTE